MTNLVVNGDFETGTLFGWSNFRAIISTSEPHTGTYNCRLRPRVGDDSWIEQESINTTNGKQYLVSFWCDPLDIANDDIRLYIDSSLVATFSATTLNTYVQFTHVYTAAGLTTLRIYSTNSPGFSTNSLAVDDVSITEYVICFLGQTKIYTMDNKNHEKKYVEAKKLDKNKHQVYSLKKNSYVPIKEIVTSGPYHRFYKIPKDSIEKDSPNEDLYLTSGHKILYNNCETKARDLPISKLTRIAPEKVYTIVTGESEPLLINNAPVFSHLVNNTNSEKNDDNTN